MELYIFLWVVLSGKLAPFYGGWRMRGDLNVLSSKDMDHFFSTVTLFVS